MISLLVFLPLLLGSLLLPAWALARAARAVGSPRGKLRFGLLAVMLILIVNVALGMVALLLTATRSGHAITVTLVLIPVQLAGIFLVARRTFALSTARTFAPFAAYVGVSLALLGLAFGVIRPFVAEAFVLPTQSMAPTLESGDRIIVNKLLRPRRWDLVAFQHHGIGDGIWCKRLIALPSERLRFEGGMVFINDQAVDMPPVLAGRCYSSIRGSPSQFARYHDGETIVLGSNDYFFIGDNVEISADSRLDGPTDRASLVGVVDLIYWPLGKLRVVR